MEKKPLGGGPILAIVAVVVVAVGFLAVRNLTKAAKTETNSTTSAHATSEDQASDDSDDSSSDDKRPKIKAMDSKFHRNTNSSGKKIALGEGGASIDVPASTTSTATANGLSTATKSTTISTTFVASSLQTTDPVELKQIQQHIADLAAQFKNETDPEARIDIADDLGLIDDPQSVKRILELLQNEKDPSVKEALLEALSGLDSLETTGNDVVDTVAKIYQGSTESEVHIAAQDVLGDIGTKEAADLLRSENSNQQSLPEEKLNSAENLLRMNAADPSLLSAEESQGLTDQIKGYLQSGTDPQIREHAAMALALNGRENLPIFQNALQTEQDPQVRGVLERLVKIFGAGH